MSDLVEVKPVDIQAIEKREAQLAVERQAQMLQARLDDIKYTSELSDLIAIMLEALTDDPKTFKKAIKTVIENG